MNDIESRIHRGMNQLAPDVFQNVLADDGPKLEYEAWLTEEKPERRNVFWMRAARTAAVMAACFLMILGLTVYQLSFKVDSVVEIDVNPSLELQVSRSGRVVRVNAFNADGVKILDEVGDSLKHEKLETAVRVLVNTMVTDGFLDEQKSSVLVSVDHGDEAESVKLQHNVVCNVKEALGEDEISGIVYHQSYTVDSVVSETAETYDISPGKAAFVHKLADKRPEFTVDELAQLTISEITELLQEEKVDVSEYVAENEAEEAAENTDTVNSAVTENNAEEGLIAAADSQTGITREELAGGVTPTPADRSDIQEIPKQENPGTEGSVQEQPDAETQLPTDGVIVEEGEAAGGFQQGTDPDGGVTEGEKPGQNPVPGGTDSGTAPTPGSEIPDTGHHSGTEENPDTVPEVGTVVPEKPVEEETGSDGQVSAGQENQSQWEDVKDFPDELRGEFQEMIKLADSLSARVSDIGLVEEEGLSQQTYREGMKLLGQSRCQYEKIAVLVEERAVSGALDPLYHQKSLQILKKVECRLSKAEALLTENKPEAPVTDLICPDGE
ncbi:MAG: hypothetical protein Q4C91_16315 [Eubacteriales bacterium]|nr:hypothetical protein [Eubacteriales bacterium]